MGFWGRKLRGEGGADKAKKGKKDAQKKVGFQKNPRVRKIRVRKSGAGNGCANFMDTWKKKNLLSAGKPPCPYNSSFFWGGVLGFLGGGGVYQHEASRSTSLYVH